MTSATAGSILILQMVLGFAVSAARNRTGLWVGTGDDLELLRGVRRHGNLAENSGVFIAGFMLLELAGRMPILVAALCTTFLVSRVLHIIGISLTETRNLFRLVGSLATTLVGLITGGALLSIALGALTTP